MEITKYTHACVRVTLGGATLLIDPGTWTEPEAFDGIDAVLLTHEHADHADIARLSGLTVPIHAPAAASLGKLRFVPIEPEATIEVAGVRIRAVGARHGLTFRNLPDVANFGFVVDERLYHPGDALALPGGPIETLLIPISGPWLRLNEALEFADRVGADRAIGIHDAMLNERGLATVNGWFERAAGDRYSYVEPGTTV